MTHDQECACEGGICNHASHTRRHRNAILTKSRVRCYNPPKISLPFTALPPSPILPPTITVDPPPPSVLPTPRIPMPPILWSQHTATPEPVQELQDSDMSSPSPEPAQELQDSDMSSPSPPPVTSQLPEYPEPPPSPKYIVTEPFTPYQRTSPPECHHNTHELEHTERPSQPWREHLAYSPPQEYKRSISPSSVASPSQRTRLSDGGYVTPDISPTMEHPYSSPPSQAPSPPSQTSLVQSSAGSPSNPPHLPS